MKHARLITLAVLCLGALPVFSGPAPLQRPPAKPGGTVALPEGVRVERDIAYVTGGHTRQKLDLYLPKAARALPLIINIHGGAFRVGSKADGVPAEYLGLGYAVASIGYRLSGDAIWPAQIEDCKAAVRWLRANAAKYGLDPDRFAAWGASAGGHLATMVGTAGGVKEFEVGENLGVSSRVQAVVDYFGPTDFLQMDAHRLPNGQVHDGAGSPESQLVGGALQENKDKVARANPITYVTKEAPPFLICHGDADPLVPHHQSVLLEAALRQAGVPVTFYTVKGAGHGRFNDPKVAELTKAFLAKHLKPAPPGGDAEAEEVCVLETSLGTMMFELFRGRRAQDRRPVQGPRPQGLLRRQGLLPGRPRPRHPDRRRRRAQAPARIQRPAARFRDPGVGPDGRRMERRLGVLRLRRGPSLPRRQVHGLRPSHRGRGRS